MKQLSIYNVLGLAETASDREVRHALRQALRENYKKTRDNFGALEDMLRFYNQASQILNDKDRRKLYDIEWSLSNASEAQRIDFVLQQAAEGKLAAPLTEGLPDVDETAVVQLRTALEESPKPDAKQEAVKKEAGAAADELQRLVSPPPAEVTENLPPTVKSDVVKSTSGVSHKSVLPLPPTVQHYHPVLTENIGYSRSLFFQGLSAGLTALMIGVLFNVAWENAGKLFETGQSWLWAVAALVVALLYYLGRKQGQRRREKDFELSRPPYEEMIKGWRRKHTVFLGSNFLAEDPSWVFQLRLTELERRRIGRTSYPHLWRRALARLFDYALWGWLLFFPLQELARLDIFSSSLLQMFSNPLVVLVLITGTWIPVEALLMAAVGTTLGKWLFGVYIQFQVSTPYAPRSSSDCWRYALQRSFRVWWQGMAMGIAPLTPIAAARARAAVERFEETDWDEELDVLVTHTPMGVILRFVGGLGLIALLFMYMVVWQRPLLAAEEEAETWISQQIGRGQNAATTALSSTLTTVTPTLRSVTVLPTGSDAAGDSGKAGSTLTPLDSEPAEETRRLAEFREAIVKAREESLLFLDKNDWKRAYESCQRWGRLEITNPAPMRCQGTALQALGRHQEAINAFRRAKMYAAPEDRSLDAAIARSQEAIFKALNH